MTMHGHERGGADHASMGWSSTVHPLRASPAGSPACSTPRAGPGMKLISAAWHAMAQKSEAKIAYANRKIAQATA